MLFASAGPIYISTSFLQSRTDILSSELPAMFAGTSLSISERAFLRRSPSRGVFNRDVSIERTG